tara:strand:+ start:5272 stop:7233 length:1962 start_codon:yes stop_codon:yes gene_type:complete
VLKLIHLNLLFIDNNIKYDKICKDFELGFAQHKKTPHTRVRENLSNDFIDKKVNIFVDLVNAIDFQGAEDIIDDLESYYNKSKKAGLEKEKIVKTVFQKLLLYFEKIDKYEIDQNTLNNLSKQSKKDKNELVQNILSYQEKHVKPVKICINRLFSNYGFLASLTHKLKYDINHQVTNDELKKLISKDLDLIAENNDDKAFYNYSLYNLTNYKDIPVTYKTKQDYKKKLRKWKKILKSSIKHMSTIIGISEGASLASVIVFLLFPYLGAGAICLAVVLGVSIGFSSKYFFETQVYEVASGFFKKLYKNKLDLSLSLDNLYRASIVCLGVVSASILGYLSFVSGGVLWGSFIGAGFVSEIISGIIAGIAFISSSFFITSALKTILSMEQVQKFTDYFHKKFIKPWKDLKNDYEGQTIGTFSLNLAKTTIKCVYNSILSLAILAISCLGVFFAYKSILASLNASVVFSKLPVSVIYFISTIPIISMFFSSIAKARLLTDYLESIPEAMDVIPNAFNRDNKESLIVKSKSDEVETRSITYKQAWDSYILVSTSIMTCSFFAHTFFSVASKHIGLASLDKSHTDCHQDITDITLDGTTILETVSAFESAAALAGSYRDIRKVKSSNIINETSLALDHLSDIKAVHSEDSLANSSRRLS